MTEPAQQTEGGQPASQGDGTTVAQLDERVGKIETAVDRLVSAVDRLLPGSHAQAQQRAEDRLDRPSSMEEQVQAELAKRDREAEEQRRRGEHDAMRDQLAKLQERPPAEPVRRATRALGWGG